MNAHGTCSACRADHRRAMDWAFQVGEPYSFVCHAGLMVVCVPLANGNHRLGAWLAGMTLPEPGEAGAAEIRANLQRQLPAGTDLESVVRPHRFEPGEGLHRAGVSLYKLARERLGLDVAALDASREKAIQQSQIAETIHAVKRSRAGNAPPYPFERERELIEKVKLGDRHGAKGVLNEILGTILFREAMGSPVLKARLVELLAILSRAAAEAGMDVEQALERNLTYFRQILESESDTDLCATLAEALNGFLDTVCVQRESRVDTPVSRVLEYIDAHFDKPLTVEELARQAHLSPSRLAHVFRDQTGITLMDAVIRARLDHARRLLLETNLSCTEIAYESGFSDQSYFTRVFRQHEKLTPREFRSVNRKPPAARGR